MFMLRKEKKRIKIDWINSRMCNCNQLIHLRANETICLNNLTVTRQYLLMSREQSNERNNFSNE